MRKVFLSNLPRKLGIGAHQNKHVIDWDNTVGMDVGFIYDDVVGVIKIINHNKSKLTILYDGKEKILACTSLLNANLGRIIGKRTNDFRVKIGTIFTDNNRNLTILGREYINDKKGINHKYYKYKCNIYTWDKGIIKEYNLLTKKQGCSCCAGQTLVEGINDIPTTAPWMVKYFQGGYNEAKQYMKCSNKKIFPVCPDCGLIQKKEVIIQNIYKNHSIGCICSDKISYPEKFIYSLLNQLHIDFISQYNKKNATWCNKYRYDYYIPYLNCIIEVHGIGHYKLDFSWLGGKTLKEEQENDELKKQLAKENGIKHYIILDCRESELEWIKKSVMKSELPTLLNFKEDDIDWSECEKFALGNLIKDICSIFNSNLFLTTVDIGNMVGFDRSTINKYLRKGSKLGWCTYNPKHAQGHAKMVICLTTGKIFGSITDAARFYNLKINSSIGRCCCGKGEYAGTLLDGTKLHWMYYEDYLKEKELEKK